MWSGLDADGWAEGTRSDEALDDFEKYDAMYGQCGLSFFSFFFRGVQWVFWVLVSGGQVVVVGRSVVGRWEDGKKKIREIEYDVDVDGAEIGGGDDDIVFFY